MSPCKESSCHTGRSLVSSTKYPFKWLYHIWLPLKLTNKTNFPWNKRYDSFPWIGFNCLKAAEPLGRDSPLLTTKSPLIPGTHFITLEGWKAKLTLKLSSDFELGAPGLVAWIFIRHWHYAVGISVGIGIMLLHSKESELKSSNQKTISK